MNINLHLLHTSLYNSAEKVFSYALQHKKVVLIAMAAFSIITVYFKFFKPQKQIGREIKFKTVPTSKGIKPVIQPLKTSVPSVQEKVKIEDEVKNTRNLQFSVGRLRRHDEKFIKLKSSNEIPEQMQKEITGVFACCFHTEETHEEVLVLLLKIIHKTNSSENEIENLFQNLIQLYDSLPKDKENLATAKIYWNKEAETILFPYLLKMPKAEIQNFAFRIVSGESAGKNLPFQSKGMDFRFQLQFFALDKEKILKQLKEDLEAHEIDFISDLWMPKSLFEDALSYTSLDYVNEYLKDHSCKGYSLAAREELIKNLFHIVFSKFSISDY